MKKLRLIMVSCALGAMTVLYSCAGGGQQQSTGTSATQPEGSDEIASVNPEAEMMDRGEEIYNNKCIACHQADGKGLANAFPSLIGSEFLLETPVMAAAQALNGSEAVPSHGHKKYPAPMPPQVDNKEDAVAAINYVLMKFNDSKIRITVKDLEDVTVNPR